MSDQGYQYLVQVASDPTRAESEREAAYEGLVQIGDAETLAFLIAQHQQTEHPVTLNHRNAILGCITALTLKLKRSINHD